MTRPAVDVVRAAAVAGLLAALTAGGVTSCSDRGPAGSDSSVRGELLEGQLDLPTIDSSARWIWVPLAIDHVDPVAFYAVREIEIDEDPETHGVPKPALLYVVADEEYVLWLNGRRVGSGRYRPGAPIDVYDVSAWLQAGTNRLVAELRSTRGQGGFLASLSDPAQPGRPILVSDHQWTIVREFQAGLVEGWRPLAGSLELPTRSALGDRRRQGTSALGIAGSPPFVWGRVGVGRWSLGDSAELLPLWSDRFFQQQPTMVRRLRRAGPDRSTSLFEIRGEIGSGGRAEAGAGGGEGSAAPIGYLTLRFANPATARQRSALVHLGRDGPALAEGGATDAVAIVVAGADLWRAPLPRRIDRIEVFGDAEALEAWVDPVDPAFPRGVLEPLRWPQVVHGVLGIETPIVRAHVERRLRRRLYGMD